MHIDKKAFEAAEAQIAKLAEAHKGKGLLKDAKPIKETKASKGDSKKEEK